MVLRMITKVVLCLLICYTAASTANSDRWIQIEGCYNVTMSSRNFSMTSSYGGPSECFKYCNNTDSVALQGSNCYCDPSYSNNKTSQNYLIDCLHCTKQCHGTQQVFCGGSGRFTMSVYSQGTSTITKMGINASDYGCVYGQNNGGIVVWKVDQYCNQTFLPLCYSRSPLNSDPICAGRTTNLTWNDALRNCSNYNIQNSGTLPNCSNYNTLNPVLSPGYVAIDCIKNLNTSMKYWIGLYSDDVEATYDTSSTSGSVNLSKATSTPETMSSPFTAPVNLSPQGKSSTNFTHSSGSPIDSHTTQVGTVITTYDTSSTFGSVNLSKATSTPETTSSPFTAPVNSSPLGTSSINSTQSSLWPNDSPAAQVGAVIVGCMGGVIGTAVVVVVVVIYFSQKYRRKCLTDHRNDEPISAPIPLEKDGHTSNIQSNETGKNVQTVSYPHADDLDDSMPTNMTARHTFRTINNLPPVDI